MKSSSLVLIGVAFAWFFSNLAFAAANSELSMTVSGFRSAAPVWMDNSGSVASTLNFSFGGSSGVAAANVDSSSVQAKLANAVAYPATVSVVSPAACSIGAHFVADTDTKILYNGAPAGSTVSVATGALQSFAVRFAATGNYGDKTGAVACQTSGQLLYSY